MPSATARRVRPLHLFSIASLLAVAASASLAACGPGAERPCVRGDQVACQCGDGYYGYRTCVPRDGGTEYSGCDCVIGLLPDAGPPLTTPYTSGNGTGGGGDAGGD